MSNSMHFNSIQATSQPTIYNYQQQSHRHHHHHHHHQQQQQQHHHHHPPATQSAPIHNPSSYSNHRLNNSVNSNSYSTRSSQIGTPILTNYQSAAYFLDRIDLENYTTQTLKQTVENILSKTKSKGLKVKISLPDDGLIIENITDPNQSWIFKTSELLYFWRDPYYLNIIVVVTLNRAHNQFNRPYSASIFRLRGGTDSAQLFLQQAQQFFSNLQNLVNNSSNNSKSTRNKSVEKTLRTENNNPSSTNKTKSTVLSTINEQSSTGIKTNINQHQSNIRRVTRAEFDPGKSVGIHSIDHRTYSETASSTDSQMNNSTRKFNEDDDDKFTTVSNNLSIDQVAELMRELKELRSEIATLKLGKKSLPSTRSMSTSPLSVSPENVKRIDDSSASTSSPSYQDATSQSEVDAETQTDYSFVSHRRRQTPRKNKKTMIGSGGVINLIKKKSSQSPARNGRRTFSNSSTNTISDQEEPLLPSSSNRPSQMNDSTVDTNSTHFTEQYQPFILATTPPRPVLMRNSTNFVSSTNSIEEGSFNVTADKEMSKFLSNNAPSSKSDTIGPTMSVIPNGSTTSFRSSLENSNNNSMEHIYENVPILIQSNSNGDAFYNIPIINADESQQQQQTPISNQSDNYVYYTINKSRENESQQQYLIPGQIVSNSPPTTDNNSNNILDSQSVNTSRQKPQIISAGRHRNQPIFFANHLTNPAFNVDKQLLINTIANQFGFDLNSPQLQQLISNQHLFAARKRTFANMVWQLTPDEETALCSSPLATQTVAMCDTETISSNNNSTARSILKANKRLQTSDKRRNITWDNSLE